jgi:hypothetical protein
MVVEEVVRVEVVVEVRRRRGRGGSATGSALRLSWWRRRREVKERGRWGEE